MKKIKSVNVYNSVKIFFIWFVLFGTYGCKVELPKIKIPTINVGDKVREALEKEKAKLLSRLDALYLRIPELKLIVGECTPVHMGLPEEILKLVPPDLKIHLELMEGPLRTMSFADSNCKQAIEQSGVLETNISISEPVFYLKSGFIPEGHKIPLRFRLRELAQIKESIIEIAEAEVSSVRARYTGLTVGACGPISIDFVDELGNPGSLKAPVDLNVRLEAKEASANAPIKIYADPACGTELPAGDGGNVQVQSLTGATTKHLFVKVENVFSGTLVISANGFGRVALENRFPIHFADPNEAIAVRINTGGVHNPNDCVPIKVQLVGLQSGLPINNNRTYHYQLRLGEEHFNYYCYATQAAIFYNKDSCNPNDRDLNDGLLSFNSENRYSATKYIKNYNYNGDRICVYARDSSYASYSSDFETIRFNSQPTQIGYNGPSLLIAGSSTYESMRFSLLNSNDKAVNNAQRCSVRISFVDIATGVSTLKVEPNAYFSTYAIPVFSGEIPDRPFKVVINLESFNYSASDPNSFKIDYESPVFTPILPTANEHNWYADATFIDPVSGRSILTYLFKPKAGDCIKAKITIRTGHVSSVRSILATSETLSVQESDGLPLEGCDPNTGESIPSPNNTHRFIFESGLSEKIIGLRFKKASRNFINITNSEGRLRSQNYTDVDPGAIIFFRGLNPNFNERGNVPPSIVARVGCSPLVYRFEDSFENDATLTHTQVVSRENGQNLVYSGDNLEFFSDPDCTMRMNQPIRDTAIAGTYTDGTPIDNANANRRLFVQAKRPGREFIIYHSSPSDELGTYFEINVQSPTNFSAYLSCSALGENYPCTYAGYTQHAIAGDWSPVILHLLLASPEHRSYGVEFDLSSTNSSTKFRLNPQGPDITTIQLSDSGTNARAQFFVSTPTAGRVEIFAADKAQFVSTVSTLFQVYPNRAEKIAVSTFFEPYFCSSGKFGIYRIIAFDRFGNRTTRDFDDITPKAIQVDAGVLNRHPYILDNDQIRLLDNPASLNVPTWRFTYDPTKPFFIYVNNKGNRCDGSYFPIKFTAWADRVSRSIADETLSFRFNSPINIGAIVGVRSAQDNESDPRFVVDNNSFVRIGEVSLNTKASGFFRINNLVYSGSAAKLRFETNTVTGVEPDCKLKFDGENTASASGSKVIWFDQEKKTSELVAWECEYKAGVSGSRAQIFQMYLTPCLSTQNSRESCNSLVGDAEEHSSIAFNANYTAPVAPPSRVVNLRVNGKVVAAGTPVLLDYSQQSVINWTCSNALAPDATSTVTVTDTASASNTGIRTVSLTNTSFSTTLTSLELVAPKDLLVANPQSSNAVILSLVEKSKNLPLGNFESQVKVSCSEVGFQNITFKVRNLKPVFKSLTFAPGSLGNQALVANTGPGANLLPMDLPVGTGAAVPYRSYIEFNSTRRDVSGCSLTLRGQTYPAQGNGRIRVEAYQIMGAGLAKITLPYEYSCKTINPVNGQIINNSEPSAKVSGQMTFEAARPAKIARATIKTNNTNAQTLIPAVGSSDLLPSQSFPIIQMNASDTIDTILTINWTRRANTRCELIPMFTPPVDPNYAPPISGTTVMETRWEVSRMAFTPVSPSSPYDKAAFKLVCMGEGGVDRCTSTANSPIVGRPVGICGAKLASQNPANAPFTATYLIQVRKPR